jgi:hypothetical protein
MSLSANEMIIEYDEELQSYYIIYHPMAAVGLGETEREALADWREVAHLGIDTMVDLKLEEIMRKEGNGHGEQG